MAKVHPPSYSGKKIGKKRILHNSSSYVQGHDNAITRWVSIGDYNQLRKDEIQRGQNASERGNHVSWNYDCMSDQVVYFTALRTKALRRTDAAENSSGEKKPGEIEILKCIYPRKRFVHAMSEYSYRENTRIYF